VLGNLAENHGLDVDKESHPRLLMLTEWFVTEGKVLTDLQPLKSTQNK
jgi:hypothetical protein